MIRQNRSVQFAETEETGDVEIDRGQYCHAVRQSHERGDYEYATYDKTTI